MHVYIKKFPRFITVLLYVKYVTSRQKGVL